MKGILKDLTNQQFGKWLVLNRDTERQTTQAYWNCKCLVISISNFTLNFNTQD